MMADPGFSGTVVGGIQDISALLPLLGTEQCEEHVGFALERGFLYSAVAPLSIFGSLGIVRAGFNILVASISIRKFKFLGAKELKNGGFEPKGDLAPTIAFDRKHPRRFLAESRLETMLADEHIPSAENLTVSWETGIFWWNFHLFVLSLTFSLCGLLPYIEILRGFDHPTSSAFIPNGWGFPILRVLGCAFCVSIPQYLIQLRILVILKARLLFITIDQYSLDDLFTRIILGFKKTHTDLWNTELPSETCIWELERWFSSSSNDEERNPDAQSGVESSSTDIALAREFYESKFTEHFGFMRHPFLATLHTALSFFLIISILATIAGYIGCFYLIQKASNDSKGPIVWLGLEILLSIVRIFVWAYNPLWDDSNGVLFKLKLSRLPPLITCTKPHREIFKDGLIPLTRGEDFIKDVVAHKGPFPLVKWDNIELYYVLKADDTHISSTLDLGKDIPGILYIVVHNYKEQSSRLISRDNEMRRFSIHICTLEFGNRNTTIDVRVDFGRDATDNKTHSFTADEKAMRELESHYDNIMSLLSDPTIKNDKFGKTWAMRSPGLIQDVRYSQTSLIPAKILKQLYRIWVGVTSRSSSTFKDPDIELGPVDKQASLLHHEAEMRRSLLDWDIFGTDEGSEYDDSQDNQQEIAGKKRYLLTSRDRARLRHGYLENRCLEFCLRMEKWIEDYMELYQKDLRDRPPIPAELGDKVDGWIRDANTREVDLVLTHCLSSMEHFLFKIWEQLSKYLGQCSDTMVENILVDTFGPRPLEAGEKHKQDRLVDRLKAAQDLQSQLLTRKYLDRSRIRLNRWMWGKPSSTFKELDRPWNETEDSLKETMLQRLSQDRSRIQKRQPGAATKDDDKTFTQFTNHCKERIEELIYRLNSQQQEFNDVSEEMISIINDPATGAANSTNLEKAYWTKESLDERLRMLRHKILYFEYTSDYALGGPQNLARALRRSRPFAFIDFDRVEEELTADGILSVVQYLKSVTGVFYRKEFLEAERKMIGDALTSNVRKILAENLDACSFTGFQVWSITDQAQSCALVSNGVDPSTCTITFNTQVPEQDHILAVQHWCKDDPEEVHFTLNGHDIDFSLRETDDFVYQDILLPAPKLRNGKNTFTISFPPSLLSLSWIPPRYYLADIWLPPVPVTRQPKDIKPSQNPLGSGQLMLGGIGITEI